ncbi:hypothetical protein [Brevundimonas sp. Leaf168]|uniref:hypothetical protein n=1 Tax=Brevundimonas sp. Leaf168 TaxID=1736283 RepID=UPI0006F23845|nr:hypothetical protein [Brevundimonas sp. Leaf168]KQR51510.1 hypothetical protein ASF81_12835 [Brevundimonas sp. Leaf168]
MIEIKSGSQKPVSADASIDFVLNHPGMSPWLKNALASALDVDPSAVLNDLEILNFVFRARAAGVSGC